MGTPIGRTVAFCLGLFALLNVVLPGDENLWWIDVRPLPGWLVALPALVLLHHAFFPNRLRRATVWVLGLLLTLALLNSVRFLFAPVERGFPVPFTLVVAALLLLVFKAPRTKWPWLEFPATALLLALSFPLAQVLFYGTTGYARPADRIVVFGARAYADGRPSHTLLERVETGCELYRRGLAPRVLLSGGPGDGAIHETEVMRRLALERGVPEQAIDLDRRGHNTRATVRNTGPGRILAVSHFYHLPRIQLAFRREGREVYTVPARSTRTIAATPVFVLREVPAFWFYWLG